MTGRQTAIGGRAATLPQAVAAAAALLRDAACPVVAGLRTDIAGAQAAAALARQLDAALDHAEAAAALRDLDVMRTAGWIVTTPLQARARADLLLLVGDGLPAAWPDLAARLNLGGPPSLIPDRPRRVLHVCPGRDGVPGAEPVGDLPPAPVALGLLRAVLAGRPVLATPACRRVLDDLAGTLRAARYGVAVWAATALDALSIEMLCGLIDDLNRTTRFAGLPLPAGGNVEGVAQALGWQSGFPLRLGFRDGVPAHDPWRYDAARLVDSGEADAVLWIDALGGAPPPWRRTVKLVTLLGHGVAPLHGADVTIAVGRPGLDHDAALFSADLGTLAAIRAARPDAAAPPVAAVLDRIAASLRAGAAAPC